WLYRHHRGDRAAGRGREPPARCAAVTAAGGADRLPPPGGGGHSRVPGGAGGPPPGHSPWGGRVRPGRGAAGRAGPAAAPRRRAWPGRRAGRGAAAGGAARPRRWRALRTMAQSTCRYGQLARIAARHGLGGFLGGRRAEPGAPGPLARRLRLALEQAGPIFVKLGQVASTRTDLLPAPVTSELARLQDHVAPVPWPLVRAVVEDELGADIGEVFEH